MGEILQAVLGVLGIIALIAVAAFIVLFLSDLTLSTIEGKKGIFFSRGEDKSKAKENEEVEAEVQNKAEQKALPYEEQENTDQVDFARADLEKQLMDEEDLALEERRQQLLKNAEEPEEKTEKEEDLDALYAQLINEINEEVKSEEPEEKTEKEEDLDDDINFDEIVKLVDGDNKEEPEEEVTVEPEETEEETVEEAVKPEETTEEVETEEETTETEENEEVTNLQAQLEELKELLAKEQKDKEDAEQAKLNLEKELEEKQNAPVVVEEGESLESLMERKSNLEERLKVTEKELKTNKKEYIPLARIKKSMEANEAKLRRKEAIVAKKKIVLFGVNNYVVDPEKEKQLADELDSLEALRLSVQHCEDVMKENEDRYPILEKTNGILTKTVEDLKTDLDTVNAKIKAIQDKDADGDKGADAE